jgi:signal transduction histidine kinase
MDVKPLTRFRISRGQKFLAIIAVLILVALGVSTVRASNEAIKASNILSDIETPAASIIFTQRETLVYATRLAQWSNGGTTRRNVQISRNLLAQRLSVIDSSGKSMGERAGDEYWSALKDADAIIVKSPSGVLSERFHTPVSAEMTPVIDRILASSRDLIVSYQKSVDAQMLENSQRAATLNRLNLTLFYLFIFVGALLLILTARSNFKMLRKIRKDITTERTALESTISELEDLNVSKNQFIATVNHELRTPLTSIIGYVDIIRDESLIKEAPHIDNYLEVVDRNAQILLTLVESALSLSKVDSVDGEIPFTEVPIAEIVERAIFVMRPASEKARIAVTVTDNLAEGECVMGDAGLLNQVLLNLLANAIKFSKEGSAIQIDLMRSPGASSPEMVEIHVRDSGIGIPADDIPHLFTRFYRAKNAISEHFQGSGLGLAIASQVLELHEGSLRVESQLGVGSTFTMLIPAYPSSIDSLIKDHRRDVLHRALNRLESAKKDELKELTHEIGGAIGFFGYEELGARILAYSRETLSSNGSAINTDELEHLISQLRNEIALIDGEIHE